LRRLRGGTSTPSYAFMFWFLIKHKETRTILPYFLPRSVMKWKLIKGYIITCMWTFLLAELNSFACWLLHAGSDVYLSRA
jgi:hypothetical protein